MLINRDHVGRLAGVDQLADGFVDQLVLVSVEVAVAKQITNALPGIVVQQQTAEHRRFRLHGVRRHTQLRHLLIGSGNRGECIILQIKRGHY